MKDLRIYLNATKVVFLFLFAFGILTAVVIVVSAGPLQFDLTPAGFSYFFQVFNAPISFLGVGFAIFATWLTLGRIEQTERQILLIAENNRFNNYYKHFDEFKKHITQYQQLRPWVTQAKRDHDAWTLSLYRHFYYRHPLDFSPRMNSEGRERVDKFIASIANSPLGSADFQLPSMAKEQFENLSSTVPSVIRLGSTRITAGESQNARKYLDGLRPEDNHSDTLNKLVYLNEIRWTLTMYTAFLELDGQNPPKLDEFWSNYFGVRASVGI